VSKLTKTVVYPFTGDQPPLTAADHRAVPSRDDVIAFYKTHERVSWSLTEMLDIPWSDIDIDALTPVDIFVAESALLVESNNPDYVANLIEYFKADQDVCDFIMMWAIEEWKHYYVLQDYIVKVRTALAARAADAAHRDEADIAAIEASIRRALGEEISDVREASLTNWGIPAHYLPVQVVANTTFQEFVTAEFYRHHAQLTREPVLARIETLLAKDETRHEMFYEARVKDCLEREPELMPLVIESLKEFGMPGAYLLGDYEARRAAMEDAAFPTLAAKKEAFVRIFGKMSRVVGEANAMRVFTEGNYLSDGQPDDSRKKMRPEMITRLVTRKLAAV
jgi:fatty acid desaturase